METRFASVADHAALDRLLTTAGTVVLFLHDEGCPTSHRAHAEVARLGGEVAVVDVRRQRDLTRAIAGLTGVRHESPQVIVLQDGRAAWAASHRGITAEAVAQAVGGHDPAPARPAG